MFVGIILIFDKSNIPSSIVLSFNHSVKIGDQITIVESKDYEIKGEVMDIVLFFTKLKMTETEEEINLPKNVFITKTIKKIAHKELVVEICVGVVHNRHLKKVFDSDLLLSNG